MQEDAQAAWHWEADRLEAAGLFDLPPLSGAESWQANLAAMRDEAHQLQALGPKAQALLTSLQQEVYQPDKLPDTVRISQLLIAKALSGLCRSMQLQHGCKCAQASIPRLGRPL